MQQLTGPSRELLQPFAFSARRLIHSQELDNIIQKKATAAKNEIAILAKAFMRYDERNTGALSREEIEHLFDDAGLANTEWEYSRLFRALDENMDDQIQLDEWLDRLPRGCRMVIVQNLGDDDRPSAEAYRNVQIQYPIEEAKVIYTYTDEAPMLATASLLPIVKSFCKSSGVQIETKDISVAGRILSQFPERLTEEQRMVSST